MNKSMKSAQSGFTLIELIVVIVILGILAATALPKFANLGGDARVASLNAAKGALSSTSAMVHGKFLVNTAAAPLTTVTVENVSVNVVNGYPKADDGLVAAAGVKDDYTVYPAGTGAGTNNVAVNSDEVMIVPASLANSPSGKTCYVKYKEAAANGAPTITVTGTAANCE